MSRSRTRFRISVGIGAGSAALGLALLSAPSSMAGSGCSNAGADIGALSKGQARTAITCLFNNERNNSVDESSDLQQAAQKHSNTMRSERCFAHDCPGEPGLKDRVKNTGYFNGSGQVGEVIAFGPDDRSPTQYVNKWLKSSEHRAQITRSSYDDVGVGINVRNGEVLLTAVLGQP